MAGIVSIAVPVPALDVLTYRWPDGASPPVAGARVDVPLGPRRLTGIVVDPAPPPPDPAMKLREVTSVRDAAPFVPASLLALTAWVADYYLAGPGDVLASALPPRVLTGDATTFKRRRVIALTALGIGAAAALAAGSSAAAVPTATGDTAPTPPLGAKQREALVALAGVPAGLPAPALTARGIGSTTMPRRSSGGG